MDSRRSRRAGLGPDEVRGRAGGRRGGATNVQRVVSMSDYRTVDDQCAGDRSRCNNQLRNMWLTCLMARELARVA